eukprot:CAMPEP_0114549956 /NCGR_PEP_ID=MMETSP0114-20121206/5806_1 /TAXON_ID=31324 /ORGANISM="Goniomonas sp, Strain m" /LENGTH=680 /DNA_ID=CAMNT_0001734677 /DNA_START=82 /DNA_END=2124 /DNA_ORIENTATION=-
MGMRRSSSIDIKELSLDDDKLSSPPKDLSPPRTETPRFRQHASPFLFTRFAKQSVLARSTLPPRPKSAMSEPQHSPRGSRPASAIPMRQRPASAMDTMGKSSYWNMDRATPKLVKKKPVEQSALSKEIQVAAEHHAMQKKLETKEFRVHQLTEHHDTLVREEMRLREQVKSLTDQLTDLELEQFSAESINEERNRQRQVQTIDAKMVYWTQALLQEDLYTRTLAYMLRRVKEERIRDDRKMQALTAESKKHNHDLQSLLIIYQDIKAEQLTLEMKTAEFRHRLRSYTQETRRRLRDRRQYLAKLKSEALASAQRRRSSQPQSNAVGPGAAELLATAFAGGVSGGGGGPEGSTGASRAGEVMGQMHFGFRKGNLEDGFRQIQMITGETDLSNLIDSFVFRDVKREHFEQLLAEAKAKVEQMLDEKARLDVRLETIKFHGVDFENERELAKEFHEKTQKWQRSVDMHMARVVNSDKVITIVRAGMDFLMEKVNAINMNTTGAQVMLEEDKGPPWEDVLGPADVADPNYADLLRSLHACERKLELAVKMVTQSPVLQNIEESSVLNRGLGLDTLSTNQRVSLPDKLPEEHVQSPLVSMDEDGRMTFNEEDNEQASEVSSTGQYEDEDDSGVIDRAWLKQRSERSQKKLQQAQQGVKVKRRVRAKSPAKAATPAAAVAGVTSPA